MLGLSPWKTPIEVWEEKTGARAPDDLSDNEAVTWGIKLEDVIAEHYAEITGQRVFRVNQTLRHRDYPWMMAHLDRRIVGAKRGLEVKTAGHYAAQSDQWGEPGTDEIPAPYLVQVMHYLAVTGYEAFDLALLAGGQEFRVYTVQRDEPLIASLIERERAFWVEHVEPRVMPPIVDLADAQRLFPVSNAVEVEASAAVAAAVGELRAAQDDRKDAEEREERAKGIIAGYMRDADTLTQRGSKILTWRSQTRKSLDTKALAAAHPELAAQFERETSFRVMRVGKAGA